MCRLKWGPSPLTRVSCDLGSSFSSCYREGDPFITEDRLYKCPVPLQKGNFHSVFRASPASAVSQRQSVQNNLYAKEARLEWHLPLPCQSVFSSLCPLPLLSFSWTALTRRASADCTLVPSSAHSSQHSGQPSAHGTRLLQPSWLPRTAGIISQLCPCLPRLCVILSAYLCRGTTLLISPASPLVSFPITCVFQIR